MAQELVLKPSGLVTDPSPHIVAPGALRVASNVVLDRDGQAEPRPGFDTDLANKTLPSNTKAKFAVSYDGDVFIWGYDSNSSAWTVHRASDMTALTGTFTPPDPNRLRTKAVESRGHLYYTTTTGLRRLTSGTDTVDEAAGLDAPQISDQLAYSIAGYAIPATATGAWQSHGYVAVLRREDASGYIRRSPPSNRARIEVSTWTTAASNALWITNVPGGAVGDVLEIYRTFLTARSTTRNVDPGTTYYLAKEYELRSTDLTALSATQPPQYRLKLWDFNPPESLGAALYTNGEQGGVLAAKRKPPYAHEVVNFKGSTFYCNIRPPHSIGLIFEGVAGDTTGNYWPAHSFTGLQRRVSSAAFTAGSQTLTGVTNSSLLALGMLAVKTSYIPANTQITAISGTIVQLSASALLSHAGTNWAASDLINVGGTKLYASPQAGPQNTWEASTLGFWAVGSNVSAYPAYVDALNKTAETFARALNNTQSTFWAYVDEDTQANQARVFIERLGLTATPFTLTTSRPTAFGNYNSNIANQAGNIGTSTQIAILGGFAWSDPHEPEAVPLRNYGVAGARDKRILRAIPTRDTLWFWKEDGLYALTGEGARNGWRVDLVDPELLLIAPDSCAVLNNRVYALTNHGIVSVGHDGVQRLSRDVISADLRGLEMSLVGAPANAHVPVGCADINAQRYLLGIGPPSTILAANPDYTKLWVWNDRTAAWTTWDRQGRYIGVDPSDGALLEVGSATYTLYRQRINETYLRADVQYTSTCSVTNGVLTFASTVTNGARDQWSPSRGDLIYIAETGDEAWVMSGSISATTLLPVLTLSTSLQKTTGNQAIQVHTGYSCTIEHVARSGGNPGLMKRWLDGNLLLEDSNYLYNMTVSTRSDLASTVVSQTLVLGSFSSAWPIPVRFWTPRQHQMGTQLLVKFKTEWAGQSWRYNGLSVMERAIPKGRTRRSYG